MKTFEFTVKISIGADKEVTARNKLYKKLYNMNFTVLKEGDNQ